MIKKILAGSALLLLPTFATAADLPRRSMAVAPAPAYAPIFTWTGFYAGANAGYGWGKSKFSGSAAGSADVDGFLIGGQAGYNHQIDSFVVGVEGDLNWADVNGSVTCAVAVTCATKTDWLGSARVRAGFAVNNILFYGTGGFGFGGVDMSRTDGLNASSTRTGWTGGAGVEYGIDRNWSVKAEYLHYDLGKDTVSSLSAKTTIDAAKIGLNYRFGGFGGPVVARY